MQSAVKDWFPDFSFDVLDDEGRIQLGYELMHHSFMQSVINLTGGAYYQASNLTWKQAYEDMVEKRSLGKDKQAQILVCEVEQRIKYEIMLEFGLAGNIGRTLEKSNCSVISFIAEDIIQIADAVQERTINELGVLTTERLDSFKRMVMSLNRQSCLPSICCWNILNCLMQKAFLRDKHTRILCPC